MTKEPVLRHMEICGELTIFTAAELRQQILDAFDAEAEGVEVDLSKVSEIDSAGIQLLLAAQREAAIRSKLFYFTGYSSAVVDIFALCNLTDTF